jgi:hypothetical protein
MGTTSWLGTTSRVGTYVTDVHWNRWKEFEVEKYKFKEPYPLKWLIEELSKSPWLIPSKTTVGPT